MSVNFIIFCIVMVMVFYLFRLLAIKKKNEFIGELLLRGTPEIRNYNSIAKVTYPDESFPNNIRYWGLGEACLDSTYQGLSIKSKLDKLSKTLDTLPKTQEKAKETFVEEFVKKYKKKTKDFIEKHFDEEEGGFNHSLHAWPTLYGTACAFLLLQKLKKKDIFLEPLGLKEAIKFLGEDKVEKAYRFILRCQSEENYGFAETPYDEPTIASTDAAILTLWNLNRKPNNIQGVRKFILDSSKKIEGNNGYLLGFNKNPNDTKPPCSSITRYAVRTLIKLEALEKNLDLCNIYNNKNQAEILKEIRLNGKIWFTTKKIKSLIEFIKSCKSSDGAFSAYAYDNKSDMCHTDMSIALIRELSEILGEFNYKVENLIEIDKLKKYIHECKSDHGGYDMSNKGYKASGIQGTRHVVNTLSNLEKEELFGAAGELKNKTKVINEIEGFLNLCFDKDEGAYFGYPKV